MSPRPCFAMKLIASGVANSAAMVRSPSFSRSSSSTTTTMHPCRISESAVSTLVNGLFMQVMTGIDGSDSSNMTASGSRWLSCLRWFRPTPERHSAREQRAHGTGKHPDQDDRDDQKHDD